MAFPYLDADERIVFPDPLSCEDDIIVSGGNLSPGVLLSAYSQGLFPWFNPDEPILWWSPDPRFILVPKEIHVSRTMKKVLKSGRFEITSDCAFNEVIEQCSKVPRPGQEGTWLSNDMKSAYKKLFELGYAHSVESWTIIDGERSLAGGMYGVSMGKCFFGESMFSLHPNASKAALIHFSRWCETSRIDLIDCQVYTPHLESLGAKMVSRAEFMEKIKNSLNPEIVSLEWSAIGKTANYL